GGGRRDRAGRRRARRGAERAAQAEGEPRDVPVAGRGRARGRDRRRGGRRGGGRRLMASRVAVVITHGRHEEVQVAAATLERIAAEIGVTLVDGDQDRSADGEAEIAIALGGDGTILSGLRRFADTGVPVFAVNFG